MTPLRICLLSPVHPEPILESGHEAAGRADPGGLRHCNGHVSGVAAGDGHVAGVAALLVRGVVQVNLLEGQGDLVHLRVRQDMIPEVTGQIGWRMQEAIIRSKHKVNIGYKHNNLKRPTLSSPLSSGSGREEDEDAECPEG